MGHAALHGAEAAHADAGALGQLLLGQRGSDAMPPQQRAEGQV
jgi:hypothetical protein